MFGFSQPPALALIQPLPAMLLVMALSHTLAATPLPHTVAADDLGTVAAAARVLSGSPWTMPESVMAADHSIIFGDEVCLGYDSLVTAADYEIELTFASDSPNRKLRVMESMCTWPTEPVKM